MGFFSDLFGKSQTRDRVQAADNAKNEFDMGVAGAKANLQAGNQTAGKTLRTAAAQTTGALDRGFATARQRVDAAGKRAEGLAGLGYDQAIDTVGDYASRARELFDPLMESSGAAQRLGYDALGVNGVGAQQGFVDNYLASPTVDIMQQQVERGLNARGQSRGGVAALASSRVAKEGFDAHVDRLLNEGSRVGQYASTLAGLEQGYGNTIAGLQAQRGTGLADLATRRGDTLAGFDISRGQQTGQVKSQLGSNLAQLAQSHFGTMANLDLNRGQYGADVEATKGAARADGRSANANAGLQLAQLAISAASGMPSFGSFGAGTGGKLTSLKG